ncbi:hypothetical protein [Actinophytocola algeriensis]|uniref:Uncharacterized protein YukE n=1 Tax=Actinophytocola algeriensis TaxID=1768010 RepID=A0A7W7QEL0_9PSEU|nr:hypothetical protein [Actinophytocola algeriensis]MBB4912038.1 uncharacterized protein YukE [Actinophytocola algeriensis]MBE1477470.1 uncharacterized protein YukE [Actinophytocola algeriensis]
MKFELPNAVAAMNNAVAAVGDDGDSWELIGDPLTKVVDEVVPAYNEKLDLKLDPSAGNKRAEVCTVRWGKIDKDVARLNGLVAAIRNVAAVIKSGKDTIAHEWKGESYDAFRLQIEKVEKTLDDYAAAVETTAAGMKAATDGTRQMFTTYRDDTVEKHLVFDKVSKPDDWWRLSANDAEFLVENCGSQTAISDCLYNNDEQVGVINGKLTNRRLFDQVTQWDCTRNPGVVIGQYNYLVDEAYEERTHISGKIHNWYVATDELKTRVGEAFDAALENLRIIAEVKVFSTLSVPGATAPAGAPSGDPGPGAGGGSPGPGPGAGYPGPGGGGGEVAMPPPGPAPEPEPMPEPEPVAAAAAEPDTAQATDPAAAETVSIKDGDRTISVSSPDGQGHVKVTVDDGSGTPKSYALDFDAASGMGPKPGTEGQQAEPEEGVEQVPARSDGKCVIKDGDVTITAERPLFSPDSISITVDDGTGAPKSYTLDFPEEPDTSAADAQPDQAAARQATNGAVPGAVSPSQDATAAPVPDTRHTEPGTREPAAREPAAQPAATQEPAQPATSATAGPAAQPAATGQETHAQAWTSDQGGSLSGVLEADQPEGEAGLASVPDDAATESSEATGMAGAGLPMMGGATGSGGGEPGRAGSGWSVHGDLFDSGEPVYSMHGVLGDDDLETREAQ